jgi:Leucine-rich repeat (LRR) protein
LRELYLYSNDLPETQAKNISLMIKNKTNLTILGLSNNKLGQVGACDLANEGLKGKFDLMKLSLESNLINNQGLRAVSEALMDNKELVELYLYNNELEDEPLLDFAKMLKNKRNLTVLGLEFNKIGHNGASLIMDATKDLHNFQKFYINNNQIDGSVGDSLKKFIETCEKL